jgi:dihydropyrimidinase
MLQDACDYTPYEGMALGAWPALTLCRGRPIYRERTLCGAAGYGTFLACERPQAARTPPPTRLPELIS